MKTFWENLTERKPLRLVAVFLVITIVAAIFTGLTFANNVIYVYDGEKVYEHYTMNDNATAEEILAAEGITLQDGDEAVLSGFDDGRTATLTVYRAFPVIVTADGRKKVLMMTRGTVGDALEKAGVSITEDDLINLPVEEELFSGAEIEIHRLSYRTVTNEIALPFETKQEESADLYKGHTDVKQKGEEGVRTETYREAVLDGEVFEKTLISSEITSEPVDQIELVGTKPIPVASRLIPDEEIIFDEDGVPLNCTRVLTGKATAYSSRRYPNVRGASGQILRPGSVAVDPKVIPYGTKMYIVSTDGKYVYGYAVAADTGTSMVRGEVLVDCFFATYEESVRFGAKKVNVYILS